MLEFRIISTTINKRKIIRKTESIPKRFFVGPKVYVIIACSVGTCTVTPTHLDKEEREC